MAFFSLTLLRNIRNATQNIITQVQLIEKDEFIESVVLDDVGNGNELGKIVSALTKAQDVLVQRMDSRHQEVFRIKQALDIASSPVIVADPLLQIRYANKLW